MADAGADPVLEFFTQTGVGFYRSTPDGRVLLVNDAIAFMLGYRSPAELMERGLSPEDYHSDTPRDVFVHRIERDGFVRGVRAAWRRRDGRWVQVQESARLVRNPDGSVRYYEGTVVDLSHLAEAESALAARESQLRTLVERSPVGIAVELPGDGIVEVNPAFCAMLGRSAEQLRGGTLADLSHDPAELAALQPQFDELHAGTRDLLTVERHYRHADGSPVHCLVSIAGVREHDRHAYSIVMAQDISERARLDAAARQAQKLDAVGRLASGIAHDFNNLLTAIAGHASFARRAAEAGESATADLEEIQRACDRAAELTSRLLGFSRAELIRPQRFDLGARILDFEQMLSRVIPDNMQLEPTVLPGAHTVEADPTHVEQVVLNLVLNARDAMPEGGRIEITVDGIDLGAEEAEALGIGAGQYVRLSVRDHGSGLPDAARERLFEPFFTTKPAGKGSGLGLATAYGIVKQGGGVIEADDAPGGGAVFRVLLPRKDTGLITPPIRRRRTPDPVRGTESILLVEDEESLRALMERVLRRSGYAVTTVDGGAAALRALEAADPPPDLLVTDVVMPEMSGPDLADAARAVNPGLRVLYISGCVGDEESMTRIRESGVPLLPKPFTPASLEQAIRTCLDVLF